MYTSPLSGIEYGETESLPSGIVVVLSDIVSETYEIGVLSDIVSEASGYDPSGSVDTEISPDEYSGIDDSIKQYEYPSSCTTCPAQHPTFPDESRQAVVPLVVQHIPSFVSSLPKTAEIALPAQQENFPLTSI